MARLAEHVDVGARAEYPLLAARYDDGADLGMLEADAVERIGQFDIDTEIVRVELEPVAGIEPAILLDIEGQGRDRARAFEAPMPITAGVGVEGNHRSSLPSS